MSSHCRALSALDEQPILASRISARDVHVVMLVATGSPIQPSVTAWIHAADSHSGDRSSTPSPPPCGQSDRLLAAVGLTALTVVPERRAGKARLGILGGGRDPDGAFTFTWPLWRDPISLVTIRALLGHPGLDNPTTRAELGIVDRLRTRRVSFARYMNVTRAESIVL